jgi:hypothetical protein
MFSRSDMGSQVLDSQEQGQKARERRGAEGLDMDFSHDPAMKKQKVRIGRDDMYIHRDTEYKACERCGNRHDPSYCKSFGEQETQDPPNSAQPACLLACLPACLPAGVPVGLRACRPGWG